VCSSIVAFYCQLVAAQDSRVVSEEESIGALALAHLHACVGQRAVSYVCMVARVRL
jgi:hypothetical protein